MATTTRTRAPRLANPFRADSVRAERFARLRRPTGASRSELKEIGAGAVDAWHMARLAEAAGGKLIAWTDAKGEARYRIAG